MGKYWLLLTEREASTTVVLPDNLNMVLRNNDVDGNENGTKQKV